MQLKTYNEIFELRRLFSDCVRAHQNCKESNTLKELSMISGVQTITLTLSQLLQSDCVSNREIFQHGAWLDQEMEISIQVLICNTAN